MAREKKARSAIKDVIAREYTINLHKVNYHPFICSKPFYRLTIPSDWSMNSQTRAFWLPLPRMSNAQGFRTPRAWIVPGFNFQNNRIRQTLKFDVPSFLS